jgi:LacI family transcriptional regulator
MAKSRSQKPVMQDVARLAGVGTMTVSRLLNGNTAVSPVATERIRWAIKQLGYERNELARAFRGQQALSIGVLLPHVADPFFSRCAYEIDAVAKDYQYSTIVSSTNGSPSVEEKEMTRMLANHVAALIVIPVYGNNAYWKTDRLDRIPVISVDRPIAGTQFDAFVVDNSDGMRQATEHLIAHGHRRIAFIGARRSIYTMRLRYQGYRTAMVKAGLEPSAYVELSRELPLDTLRTILRSDQPTALISASNRVTSALLPLLRIEQIAIPNDIAWIAFDDFEFAEYLEPSLTVIRQPEQELARLAAQTIFERLDQPKPVTKQQLTKLGAQLVIRRSCGCTST